MENNEKPNRPRKGVTPVRYGQSLSSPGRPHSNREGVSQTEQPYQTSSADFERNPRGHRGPKTYRGEQVSYGSYRTERPGDPNHPGAATHASSRGGNSFSQYPQHHKTATDFGRSERRLDNREPSVAYQNFSLSKLAGRCNHLSKPIKNNREKEEAFKFCQGAAKYIQALDIAKQQHKPKDIALLANVFSKFLMTATVKAR